MRKRELIEALENSIADDDEEVILWSSGCKRTISDIDYDVDGLTLELTIPET